MRTAVKTGEWCITVHEGQGVIGVSLVTSELLLTDRIALELAVELEDLIEARQQPRIVLDLEGATFVSEGMLKILGALCDKVRRARGVLIACNVQPAPKAAFLLPDLRAHLQICPSFETAMRVAAA